MSNNEIQSHAQELDSSSLDLIVGGAVMIPDATAGSETDIRKQEQSDKLKGEQDFKQR